MPSYQRLPLSGSSNYRTIAVAATASTGTLIHTAITGTSGSDEVYVYAANVTASSVSLSIEWGGTTDPTDLMMKSVTLPPNCPVMQIIPGISLSNGVAVRAFAGTANAINITGHVNRVV